MKKEMLNFLLLVTKGTPLSSVPIAFSKVILCKIDTFTKIARKKIVFSGIFIFHIILQLTIGSVGWIKALYMESIQNKPFSVRFQ
jgi:hypothetical protein